MVTVGVDNEFRQHFLFHIGSILHIRVSYTIELN